MNWLIESVPIWVWGWGDILFSFLLVLGVCGECDWAAKLLIRDSPQNLLPLDSKRARLKHIAEIMVIIGVGGELVCLVFSLHESAKLNKEAATAWKEANELRLQIVQITNNDLLNLPVRSISMDVGLWLRYPGSAPQKIDCDAELNFAQSLPNKDLPMGVLNMYTFAGESSRMGIWGRHWYIFKFEPRFPPNSTQAEYQKFKSARGLNDVVQSTSIRFITFCLTNCDIDTGEATLVVNGRPIKQFGLAPGRITNGVGSIKSTNAENLYLE